MARLDRQAQLQAVIESVQPLDEQAMAAAQQRQDLLTKPPGSLGRLELLAVQLAGITGVPLPRPPRKAVIVSGRRPRRSPRGPSALRQRRAQAARSSAQRPSASCPSPATGDSQRLPPVGSTGST